MRPPLTLSTAYELAGAGEDRRFAAVMGSFLDDFYTAPTAAARFALLADRPALTGNTRRDALAGAIAEYLAKQWLVGQVPRWAGDPERFLAEP